MEEEVVQGEFPGGVACLPTVCAHVDIGLPGHPPASLITVNCVHHWLPCRLGHRNRGLESVSLVHRFLVGNEGIDIIKFLHWKNITKDQKGSFRA